MTRPLRHPDHPDAPDLFRSPITAIASLRLKQQSIPATLYRTTSCPSAVMDERAMERIQAIKTDNLIEKTNLRILPLLRILLRFVLMILPILALRALFWPRQQRIAELTDHQLADIGLTRGDVQRPHERTLSAELDAHRLLRERDWR